MSEQLTGGDAVVQALEQAGVEVVFGLISIHNLPIYDALQRRGTIRAITCRSEAGAANMADAYARASGRLGVVITSTGAGAGNAMGSLVEAQTAGSPVLHLTGNIASTAHGLGRGAIHETKDQLGMLQAVSKAAWRVPTPAAIAPALHAAIDAALTAPRGVASVEIPIDFQYAAVPPLALPPPAPPCRAPAPDAVRTAAALLANARRPLIVSGSGVLAAEATAELRALAEALGAGVVTSGAGRGALPEDHPLCLGNHGNSAAVHELLATVDVLLLVATRARPNELVDWASRLPPTIVQVDADPLAMGRTFPVTAPVLGDARLALAALREALPRDTRPDPEYAEAIAATRAAAVAALRQRMGPYTAVLDALHARLPRDAIKVRDVTVATSAWGNRLLAIYEPRTSIHAVGGGIGQGLAMAIGAQLARPDRRVVLLVGDGGLMCNIGELACAAQERTPIVIVLFNDGGYGVLRAIQAHKLAGRYIGVDLQPPDFVRLTEAFGGWARRITALAQFDAALAEALDSRRLALLELDMAAIGAPAATFAGPPPG